MSRPDTGVPASPSGQPSKTEPSCTVSAQSVAVPNACEVPPEGWYCTRERGHDGPCAAVEDPIVGSGCREDGKRIPIRKSFADYIWAQAEAEREQRERDMPDEQSAIKQLWSAQERLKELGWKDPVYAPKDGSPLDIIELGSTGIHHGYYQGEWPTGSWWIVDGDVWPSRPALARAAIAMARDSAANGDLPVPLRTAKRGNRPTSSGDNQ